MTTTLNSESSFTGHVGGEISFTQQMASADLNTFTQMEPVREAVKDQVSQFAAGHPMAVLSNSVVLEQMEKIRVIRKYSNRKLYDTATSEYCGLPEVVQWIKAGENIQVIEYDTHRNITNEILLKAIFEREIINAEHLSQISLIEILKGKENLWEKPSSQSASRDLAI